MKMAKAFIGALLTASLLTSCMAAGSPALAAEGAAHATLTIGMSQFPSTLHPMVDDMLAKSIVNGATLRPITAHNAAWQPECLLCTDLPSYDNGMAKKETRKDGKKGIAATYTLKDNLFWGDGTPVTTKDILFAYDVGRHPKSGVSDGEFFSKDIVGIDALDDRRFTIHFDKEKCDFAAIDDFYPLPAHLERAIFDKDPETYKNRTLYNTDPANPGLWLGPYEIAKVDSGAALVLQRNPQWKGKAPAFDKITFRTIENSAALTASLLSGDIDYIAGELGVTLDQAIDFEKRLKAQKPGQFEAVYKPSLTFEHIDLNLDQPPFNDLRVRQALMYAMDRDALNKQLFGGRQPVASTDINPLDTVYNKDVAQYPHDPAKAAALLDAAGFKLGDDGYRHDAKGNKLSIVLSTTAGNKSRELIEQAIQSDWKKSGIATSFDNQQARVLFGDTMRKRQFKGGVMYAWMSAPQSIPKTTLYSSMIPTADNNYSGQNYSGWNDKTTDKLIDDLDVVCEKSANQKLWDQLQQRYAEQLPALPLYYRADSFFIPHWLKGIVPTGHLNPTTLWIEDWSVAP